MKVFIPILLVLFFSSCSILQPKVFEEKSLEEQLTTLSRNSISWKEILAKENGKQTIIQIYASYCPYSQESLEEIETLQQQHKDIRYLFISVDHSIHDWQRGLKNINVTGEHYYLSKKEEGELGKFLHLKNIPRFLLLDKNGKIRIFNTSKVSTIENNIKKIKP
jgi:thiol-disulfide isomerase/thioredoxin